MLPHVKKALSYPKTLFRRWQVEEKAVALVETAILFPVMISMLMAVYDLGQGVAINQKTVAASQIMADLLTRTEDATMNLVDDVIMAGELALEPYDITSFGYDIVSVRFDDDGNPQILWRVTENADPNDDAVASTFGLGDEGEGVVVVTTVYRYVPFFSNFVVNEINMKEVAFLRGRKSITIPCDDCPAG